MWQVRLRITGWNGTQEIMYMSKSTDEGKILMRKLCRVVTVRSAVHDTPPLLRTRCARCLAADVNRDLYFSGNSPHGKPQLLYMEYSLSTPPECTSLTVNSILQKVLRTVALLGANKIKPRLTKRLGSTL